MPWAPSLPPACHWGIDFEESGAEVHRGQPVPGPAGGQEPGPGGTARAVRGAPWAECAGFTLWSPVAHLETGVLV